MKSHRNQGQEKVGKGTQISKGSLSPFLSSLLCASASFLLFSPHWPLSLWWEIWQTTALGVTYHSKESKQIEFSYSFSVTEFPKMGSDITKNISGLCPWFLAQSFKNHWNFLNDKCLCYVNEVIHDLCLDSFRMEADHQKDQARDWRVDLSSTRSPGKRWGLEMEYSHMGNVLINHTHLTKPQQKLWTQSPFWLVNTLTYQECEALWLLGEKAWKVCV